MSYSAVPGVTVPAEFVPAKPLSGFVPPPPVPRAPVTYNGIPARSVPAALVPGRPLIGRTPAPVLLPPGRLMIAPAGPLAAVLAITRA